MAGASLKERVLIGIFGVAPISLIPVVFFFALVHKHHSIGLADVAMFVASILQLAFAIYLSGKPPGLIRPIWLIACRIPIALALSYAFGGGEGRFLFGSLLLYLLTDVIMISCRMLARRGVKALQAIAQS